MWFDKYYASRKKLIIGFVLVSVLSACLLPFLKFAFNFEQFFPVGDKDLEFFQEFIEEFESDDNFLLIAFEHKPSIFDTSFLKKVDQFTDAAQDVPYVKSVQSLTNFSFPTLTPLGPRMIPAVSMDDPTEMSRDSIRLLNDERLVHNLINQNASSTVVILKTEENTQIEECKSIMHGVNQLIAQHNLPDHYMLGRAYFQTELSALQFREIFMSTVVSSILISIVMILIFRRWRSILIALGSIGVGLLIFMGLLSLLGRELTLMAALYPILMLIVGTSDVIHIMTKYFDELKKGFDKKAALETTIRQIGMATLLTSLTTAAGFATLLSSRIIPIKDFGINAAMGVVVAYIVVIGFTCPLLSYFRKEQLIKKTSTDTFWNNILSRTNAITKQYRVAISIGFFLFIGACLYGMSMIHTNYEIAMNLPKGAKITEDFKYFEKEYAGFRPIEFAVFIQEGYNYDDYEVLEAITKTEDYIRTKEEIASVISLGTIMKSLNQAVYGNNPAEYKMPSQETYALAKPVFSMLSAQGAELLVSKDKRKSRISSKIKDIGAEKINIVSADIDRWIDENIDSSIVQFNQTGTGLILDKNSEFVRESLLYGLGMALIIVSLLMGMLFRNIKMLLLALIPNVIPLLFAAALIGYFDIALEAGISIVFAIIFGIAVDDTIHFLSKYKLAKDRLGDREAALEVSFVETGKAIIFTSIILFFGFAIMLFSSNLPSVIIGMLISVTLVSAILADLIFLPVIIRFFDI